MNSKEWIKYIEFLNSIGRKNTNDLTTYEACHLCGLLMRDSSIMFERNPDKEITSSLMNYLINQEPEDEKNFLNTIKSKVIDIHRKTIDTLLENQEFINKQQENDKPKTDSDENDESNDSKE